MERLIFDGNFCDIAICREYPCPYNGTCSQKKTRERLKAYEDTSLEPEQIRNAQDTLRCFDNIGIKRGNEIVTAEEEGRLLVLPCKVGDTVWAIRNYRGRKVPQKSIVSEMYFLPDMTLSIVCKYVARGQFGKTVFLTREEAEAALKGGEG